MADEDIALAKVLSNPFAILLNVFTLWDLHWVNRLEKWQAIQKDNLPRWFDALQEIEAVLSFATLYYNNPKWTFKISQ